MEYCFFRKLTPIVKMNKDDEMILVGIPFFSQVKTNSCGVLLSFAGTQNSVVNYFNFFSIRVFFHRHRRFTGQQGKGGDHLLFHSTTSTCSRTLRHLFATLHVRWLSSIFNRNTFVYQTTARWDLPRFQTTIWLLDLWCNICLFTWWIDSRLLLQQFDMGNR